MHSAVMCANMHLTNMHMFHYVKDTEYLLHIYYLIKAFFDTCFWYDIKAQTKFSQWLSPFLNAMTRKCKYVEIMFETHAMHI